jgi:predicted GNAT family acetyltransferase
MEHPLDRPAWHALHGPQASLAIGAGRALRYEASHAIFATTGDHAPESLAALGALIGATGPAIIIERPMLPLVPGTLVQAQRDGVQMVTSRLASPPKACDFVALGEADAAEMLALATLTEPGPFFTRTHRLGAFIGVRREGRLIAMAGERMRPPGLTEVSGVCTHPDFRGQGLAAALMHYVAAQILARGQTPFLHAYADNASAIALYERLGFEIRCPVSVTVLEPA